MEGCGGDGVGGKRRPDFQNDHKQLVYLLLRIKVMNVDLETDSMLLRLPPNPRGWGI